MDFSNLPGFSFDTDLTPLTTLHNSTTNSSNQPQPTQSTAAQPDSLANFQFASTLTDVFPPASSTSIGPNGTTPANTGQKVFFITNCGSLLGRTIAQVALDRGHLVAACAREKHLGDLAV